MVFLEWTTDYDTGIDEIDEQHKRLVELLNTLYTSFIEKNTDLTLVDILKELTDYAEYHFTYEEALFAKSGYPREEDHIQEHQELFNEIEAFKIELERGHSITYKLMTFLRKWVSGHLLGIDKDYIPYIQNKSEDCPPG